MMVRFDVGLKNKSSHIMDLVRKALINRNRNIVSESWVLIAPFGMASLKPMRFKMIPFALPSP